MGKLQERIRERRKAVGMTLAQLADRTGVQEATVQRWESGNIKNIKHETIEKIAIALNCSPVYLMGWTEDPYENAVSSPALVSAAKQDLIAMIDDLPDDQVEKLLQIARTVFEK